MKFGNYNINTEPKERSRKFDVFRFSKIKSTTNNFVGRFHSKFETFRRLKSRSESPLSYRASLFERDGGGLFPRPVSERFSPKDFPKNHFREDNFYVFGNTIRKLSVNQKTISGKNNYLGENFYCTLKTVAKKKRDRAKSGTNNFGKIHLANKKKSSKMRQYDSIEHSSSGIGSYIEKEIDLNNVNDSTINRRYTSSLKDILDSVSHLDEDTEFKVLKEYFETNSYSDIIHDSAFKDYLNKKNYVDILDYLNEESVKNDTIRLRLRTPFDDEVNSFYDNATDTSKLYKWKSTGNLYESLSTYNNTAVNSYHRQMPTDRLETNTYRRQRKPAAYINSTTSLNRGTNSRIFQRQRERERQNCSAAPDKSNFTTNYRYNKTKRPLASDYNPTTCPPMHKYDDVKHFCETLLPEHFAFNNNLSNIDTTTLAKRYTERQYKKLITKFIKGKGYLSTDEYVHAKFGTILDRSIPRANNYKSEKLDLPKTYIDNVQRRYHVTKQHFLAAERMRDRSSFLNSHGNSYSLNDLPNYNEQTKYTKNNIGFNCRSALDRCTGGCMTIDRNKRGYRTNATNSTGSLPSEFRSAKHKQPLRSDDSFAKCHFYNSNCDIYCKSCMSDHFQHVPYRREYYNVSNNYYDFNRNCARPREQPQQQYRHKEYNHINGSTHLCSSSNYVN